MIDITVALTRTSIFVAVYSLVLGIPFLLAFGWQERLISWLGPSVWWLAPLVTSTVLATGGPFIYLFIQRKAEARLFEEQLRYQTTLRQASAGMGRIKDLNRLINLIVHIVSRTVRLEHAMLYLEDAQTEKFILGAKRSRKVNPFDSPTAKASGLLRVDTKRPILAAPAGARIACPAASRQMPRAGEGRECVKFSVKEIIAADSTLIKQLRETQLPIVYEEIKQRTQDCGDLKLARLEKEMSELDAAVVVPVFLRKHLIALLILGEKENRKLFTEADLNAFQILANQAALGIENARYYDEIRSAHERLFQAEKLAYVGTLAGSIVHEIRNPLTSIKTYIEYLPKKYAESDFRRKFDHLIPKEISRIENVVNQLLGLVRRRKEVLARINIIQVIDETLELMQNSFQLKDIRIEKHYDGPEVWIEGDAEHLRQAFMNLFLNALQAMSENGTLKIRVSLLRDANDEIRITIQDTGCGIAPERLAHLFEPFQTTKKDGIGLGLSITREIIKKHNGEIEFSSKVGEGTTVTIELPSSEKI